MPSLTTFACGTGSPPTPPEAEVDDIVHGIHSGRYELPLVFLVAEERDTGQLVAVCAVSNRPLEHPQGVIPDAAYVGVIGIQRDFRGRRLPDGVTRIGDFMLREALERILSSWGFAMPPVWALIDPGNDPSQDLFRRHDFEHVPTGGKYDIWYRGRGLALPQRSWAT